MAFLTGRRRAGGSDAAAFRQSQAGVSTPTFWPGLRPGSRRGLVVSFLGVALLPLIVLTLLLLGAMHATLDDSQRSLRALDALTLTESALHRDVLSARSGLLRTYDPVVRETAALHDEIGQIGEWMPKDSAGAPLLAQLEALQDKQEDLVEHFKTDNAMLQNSLAYFEVLSAGLDQTGVSPELAAKVSVIAAAVLDLTLEATPRASGVLDAALRDFATLPIDPAHQEMADGLLRYGNKLESLLPDTNQTLRAMFALPIEAEMTAMRDFFAGQHARSEARAARFRFLLYVAAVLFLACAVLFGHGLRVRARALRWRVATEHLIADLSMRFIDAEPEMIGVRIVEALAALANHIGAARAYLMPTSGSGPAHLWSRADADFPPGWPGSAVELACSLDMHQNRTMLVADAAHMPDGRARELMQDAGLQGWACIIRPGTAGPEALLGFDSPNEPMLTNAGELGTFRMALDALTNALSREVVERARRELEGQMQRARRMETVGALTSGIAHNFNNIIGAILGFTEMAEVQLPPQSRAAPSLAEIRRAAERARDLIDQILTFGRHRQVRRGAIVLNDLVSETAGMLAASLPPGIVPHTRQAPERTVVMGDPAQLQQVILNLCNNAAQAMTKPGIVTIETELHELRARRRLSHDVLAPGRYVCLAVTDAGRGMDQATLGRIFQPFFTTRSGGNGLGLATVREIVHEHRGGIDVRSKLESGTRFEVWLPCTPANALPPARSEIELGSGQTVMLVEDSHDLLLRDEEMLAALGYEPIGIPSAEDALELLRTTPARFDAVVIGKLEEPDATTLLAAAIRQAAPHLPIILSVNAAEEIGGALLATTRIDALVRRPLTSAEIAAVLARCAAAPRTTQT